MKTTGESTNGDPDVIEENNASKPEVARVSVRLPTFWAKQPASWFAQAEAQFHLAGITNERTQFYHVISQLDEKYVAEVDIINSPPQHEPYTALKMELVKRLCPSKDQCTRQLFEFEEMGDRKPSQFLRHLRSLGPDIPADYLKIIWTSRLPSNIRTILAGLPEVELDAAALCADRIMETISIPAVTSITPGPDYSELLRQVCDLSLRITNLTEENKHLSDIVRQDNVQRHRSRSIS
jgi:cleavage and polyadenylation specificity factor subunit 1